MALLDVSNVVNTILILARIISIILLVYGGLRIATGDLVGGLMTVLACFVVASSWLITVEFFGIAGSGLPSINF